MNATPTKRKLSLRLTDDETSELVALRQALELSERKTSTLQGALRRAIAAGSEADRSGEQQLRFHRIGTERENRYELVIDDDVGAKLDAMQAARPDETHASIVLACVRVLRSKLDEQLRGSHSRRRADRRP